TEKGRREVESHSGEILSENDFLWILEETIFDISQMTEFVLVRFLHIYATSGIFLLITRLIEVFEIDDGYGVPGGAAASAEGCKKSLLDMLEWILSQLIYVKRQKNNGPKAFQEAMA
ncbi:hypothetical protein ACJX0J_009682, partial [Zea mays]